MSNDKREPFEAWVRNPSMWTKPFNAEHAKAGAPYCQRNGLAARIGIWDAESGYPLVGVRLLDSLGTEEVSAAWNCVGTTSNAEASFSLVMLPLGYCEGKPVFVGDELRTLKANHVIEPLTAAAWMNQRHIDNCKWPRTAPMMPIFFAHSGEQQKSSECLLAHYRSKIELYWKQLDEFNGVKA